ncbi:type IV pilin protein [Synechococcus sp. CC9616]|uniref:type IV pilin protein n=1 Tax=Synechococcus sp. CC9616 TaxID=110663 RepID=UPI0004B63D2A|nr:prepilin-type N-terminal cleavage/methylation domain-containing protein [Synechococcus sp. CC9616]
MTSLNSKLQLTLINRKKGRNLLEKGFTLVELMIVIVIVGILSAVALPNFLSQTSKAKATEAKTLSSAALKEAQVAWTEKGAAGLTTWKADVDDDGQCPPDTDTFDIECTNGANSTIVTVTSTGSDNAGDLEGKTVVATLDVATGGKITFCGDAPGLDACVAPAPGG